MSLSGWATSMTGRLLGKDTATCYHTGTGGWVEPRFRNVLITSLALKSDRSTCRSTTRNFICFIRVRPSNFPQSTASISWLLVTRTQSYSFLWRWKMHWM